MRPEVQVEYRGSLAKAIDPKELAETIARAFQPLAGPLGSATVVISSDARVRGLSRRFRGVDAPTDVLAFPASDETGELGTDKYLGDIVIAAQTAASQAAQAGHSLQDELTLLAVHGILHLLGYDHEQPDQKRRMWSIQRELLDILGLAHIQPTEE